MDMSFKKVKTIAKAFVNPLPVGEDWYEKRLEICNGCEYNSANIESIKLSFGSKLKIQSKLCDNGNHCTACGCCIERKCGSRVSECGLVELKMEPKWKAIDFESEKTDFTVEYQGTDAIFSVSKVNDREEFLFDFGQSSANVLKSEFVIRNKKPFDVLKFEVSCGCTHPEVIQKESETSYRIVVNLSTLKFREGLNEKTMTFFMDMGNGKQELVFIRYRAIKQL
jgi:hypothetical protein